MKQQRLPAHPHTGEMIVDASMLYSGYTQVDDGVDLVCGNPDCNHVIFPKYPRYVKGDTMRLEGIQCPSCGWDNTLDTGDIK